VWKRLSTIADEDVGQPNVIVAVDCLYRKFQATRRMAKEKKISLGYEEMCGTGCKDTG